MPLIQVGVGFLPVSFAVEMIMSDLPIITLLDANPAHHVMDVIT